MGSFSGLGIGLSFVFGCILMGLVAELYYLLWWKKRVAFSSTTAIEDLSFFLCWKRPATSFNSASSSMELTASQEHHQDLEMGCNSNNKGYGEDGIETEIMRAHNMSGPPRFLFPIKEENKEDLESEDGRSRKGSRTSRSLSDLVFGVDGINGTPFLTPLSSPTIKNGFNNPLFEESEMINRLRSSPPPNLKFLRDAEEKLMRKLLMEEADKKRDHGNIVKVLPLDDDDDRHEIIIV